MSSCDKSHADHDRTKITFPTVSVCALALWLAVEPDGATLLTLLAALLTKRDTSSPHARSASE